MSRDTRDGASERGSELLAAYVDGVAELSTDERRRIEARLALDPEARADAAELRALLDQLRALPPEGSAPDWAAMERSIHHAVGREVPRPWWRSWRWLAPTATLATAMLVLLVMWGRPATLGLPPGGERIVGHDLGHDRRDEPAAFAQPGDEVVPLWLDGDEVDVTLSANDLLGDPAPGDPASGDQLGLLPSGDLAWVDRLDDAALARAERWLAGETANPGAPPRRKG